MNFTPIARIILARRSQRTASWRNDGDEIQRRELSRLISHGAKTGYGRACGLDKLYNGRGMYRRFAEAVPVVEYEQLRPHVMRMIAGERDVLWPGRCMRFAQSSGTSGGKSKYIPVTTASLRRNHYRGSADSVGHYLLANPKSRLFSGKGLILGGSFANEVNASQMAPGVKIGDLSATLIDRIPGLAGMFRVPSKEVALMSDWSRKLPAIARGAIGCDITNISGVPSWFLTVIRTVLSLTGRNRITDVWPNLEVFFHGGISFAPYREEYERLCDMEQMHFVETYNASEGFFATARHPGDRDMLLLLDTGVFYEFIPAGSDRPVPLWEVEKDKVYELVITSCNGLWRYRLGDTVLVHDTAPVTISLAGRTKSFINAFGEEVMEYNADAAVEAASKATGASVANYTVAPVYARDGKRGRHQWVMEWEERPDDMDAFVHTLDTHLQQVNSDYQAKRSHTIFLDAPQIVSVPEGTFDHWLRHHGTGRLGGQRKVPRLSNDRTIVAQLGITPEGDFLPQSRDSENL